MLRLTNKLTVLHDDNGVFKDYSDEALAFDRDSFTIDLNAAEDYLYIGYYKPIHVFFVEIATANTNAGSFAAQYYDSSLASFASLSGFHDDTKSLTRSGFVQWDANQASEGKTTVNSMEKYWYRFRPSVTHSSTVVSGLNIIFADDVDLKREYREVGNWIPEGENSHILTHVASRDEIIQFLRNNGHYKQSLADGRAKNIDAFDLLDLGQIKLAATYLCLSKIFLSIQDDPDGLYKDKSETYRGLYTSAINTWYLDLDRDDDGIKDVEEELAPAGTRMVRR